MNKNEDLSFVTEVGTFGDLNIADPTEIKTKKKQTDMEALIEASIAENLSNLTIVND